MNKRYLYSYTTITDFSVPISKHIVRLRCQPQACNYQNIVEEHLILPPDFWWNRSVDGQGNALLFGGMMDEHASLAYVSSGIVEHTSSYVIVDEHPHPMYRQTTALTRCHEEMKALIPLQCGRFLDDMLSVVHSVHEWMTYTPGATGMLSSAFDAFISRRGVCQDYAHLMISICRAMGYASRYVCGLMVGEGETHAWVEVHDGHCWYAFDPTNDTAIATDYIKLAHGRDASDCPVSRGSFIGMTKQTTRISVLVNEMCY